MTDDENTIVTDQEQVSDDMPRFFWFRFISFILLIVGSAILSGESTKWGEWDLGWPLWAYPCCVAGIWTLAGLIWGCKMSRVWRRILRRISRTSPGIMGTNIVATTTSPDATK